MPDILAIADVSWTDPRVLFLVGLILSLILGALVFVALQLERSRLNNLSRQEDAERLGRAFAGTGLCFWDWDIANGIFSYDKEWFLANLGYEDPVEELGLDFNGSIIHPEDLEAKNEALYRHMVGESDSYSAEFRLRRKNGSWVWILSRGKVFERDKTGRALRFAGADSIIEQQKSAELVLEIEKEVSVRFGEVYTAEGILQALAEGLVRLHEFEFAMVFLQAEPGQPMQRIFGKKIPKELDSIHRLKRQVGSVRVCYYDESDLASLMETEVGKPMSVTELQIVRGGEVAGCVWVGAMGRTYAPNLVLEAIEQLEVQAQAALDRIESEAFYRAGQRNLNSLINSIDEMIFILNQDYQIVYANDVAGTELGLGREDLVGTNLLEFIPEEGRELTRENFEDLVSGNLPLCSAQFLKEKHRLLRVEVQITSGRWGETDALFCVVRNAGRRDEASRALERRDQRLRVASRALVELITASDMEASIREAVNRVASVFGSNRICVSEKVRASNSNELSSMDRICCWTEDNNAVVNLGGGENSEKIGLLSGWAESLRKGDSVAVIRDSSSEEEREYLERMGVRSLLLVPIHLRDIWWGVMGAEMHGEAREWSSGDISLLEIVGSGLAGLVETVRLQRDLIAAKEETEKTNLELGEAIRHAQDMANEASQANRSKTEFLANMSHEIRTPMNAILGFAELIEAEIQDPALVEFLRAIRSSGKTLLALINDLLDLSKIEAGKMSLQYEPVSLSDLIQDMMNIFQVRCDEKGIQLESEIASDLPARLLLDESRIRQIIFNLLGNAVKFTHQGKVELRVGAQANSQVPHRVDLSIEIVDTGIGIEKDDQKSIFEPFEQSRGQKQKVYGGTGLGLSITSRLVKMMNGTLSLSSSLGKGSSFVVKLEGVSTLDTNEPRESETIDVDVEPNEGDGQYRGMEILVVDDNPLNRRVLGASLRSVGVEVREASDGEECLRKLEENLPDLVLMDILMPGMSGGETTVRIHENPDWSDLPIVACTALDLTRARQVSESACFDDILVKPVSQGALRSVLERFWVKGESRHVEKGSKSSVVDGELQMTKSIEKEVLPKAQGEGGLSQLVGELEKKFYADWAMMKKRFQIEPILQASNEMLDLGRSYDEAGLVEYAERLLHLINIFDVQELKRALDEFSDVLERIREKASVDSVVVGAAEGKEAKL